VIVPRRGNEILSTCEASYRPSFNVHPDRWTQLKSGSRQAPDNIQSIPHNPIQCDNTRTAQKRPLKMHRRMLPPHPVSHRSISLASSPQSLKISPPSFTPPRNNSSMTRPPSTVSFTIPSTCFGSTRPYQIPVPARADILPSCPRKPGGI
jgi:hypothetical protein